MIGVVRYSVPCRVCAHEDREQITAALLAYGGALALSKEYAELTYRDVKAHERHCLPQANNQTNRRRTP